MIKFPNFVKIHIQCRELLKQKFPHYGNSWIGFTQKSWWKRRLRGEINEVFRAKNSTDCKKEICDAINILAMMYENAEGFRYKK